MKATPLLLHLFFFGATVILIISGCGQRAESATDQAMVPVSPVQVTSIEISAITSYIELTAVSSYQQKSFVKVNMNGYVQSVNIAVGKQVQSGTMLFTIISKEAKAIGNSVNQLDPGLKFSGVSAIRADQQGFVTALKHQKGDYVQDGEALAEISNKNSFVFLLDLPYELRKLVNSNQAVSLTLPDGELLEGTITGSLPVMDSIAQTQKMIISVMPNHAIPEGLIAKVQLIRAENPTAQVLPRSAILTNDTEDEFWVMKLINDSTAIKVPVKKGIENAKHIEILNPVFNSADRIITTGNYGIADTAKVKIVKQP